MQLTSKEKIFLKRYKKFYLTYILFFLFVAIVSLAQFYLFFANILPYYTTPLQRAPVLLNLIKEGLSKTFEIALFWLALFIGCLVGDFLTYLKIRKIIKKLFDE